MTKYGLARQWPRLTAATQIQALEASGFETVYVLGEDRRLTDVLCSLKRGDVVGVMRLWVVANPGTGRAQGLRRSLYAAVDAIEARGATIEEVDTGRSSADPRQRDEMIREAAESVSRSGRRPGNAPRGRREARFSVKALEQAEQAWNSRELVTWKDVAAALPKGFTVHRAYRLWGARNSDGEIQS